MSKLAAITTSYPSKSSPSQPSRTLRTGTEPRPSHRPGVLILRTGTTGSRVDEVPKTVKSPPKHRPRSIQPPKWTTVSSGLRQPEGKPTCESGRPRGLRPGRAPGDPRLRRGGPVAPRRSEGSGADTGRPAPQAVAGTGNTVELHSRFSNLSKLGVLRPEGDHMTEPEKIRLHLDSVRYSLAWLAARLLPAGIEGPEERFTCRTCQRLMLLPYEERVMRAARIPARGRGRPRGVDYGPMTLRELAAFFHVEVRHLRYARWRYGPLPSPPWPAFALPPRVESLHAPVQPISPTLAFSPGA